jgi:hypothetical protein
MTKQKICLAVIEIYTEFFRQVTLNKTYVFVKHHRELLYVSRFADWLLKEHDQEQIGITFLIDFFKFQFSRYSGKKTQYGVNVILIHWLIGDKAQKAWKDQKFSKKWIVKVRLKKTIEIRLIKAFEEEIKQQKLNKASNEYTKIYQHEENDKQRFYNTAQGFIYCNITTTLFNPKSEFCSQCIYSENCKSVMMAEYPKLYKLRINE